MRDLNLLSNSVDTLKPSLGWDNHLGVLLDSEQNNVVRNGLESFISQQGVLNPLCCWLSHIYTLFPLCPKLTEYIKIVDTLSVTMNSDVRGLSEVYSLCLL